MNGKSTHVAIKSDGILTIDLSVKTGESPLYKDGESSLYIGGVDYEECKRLIWYSGSPISMNDTFEIKVAEIEHPSLPSFIEEDLDIKRPMTKLEFFRYLENNLKKQGLL